SVRIDKTGDPIKGLKGSDIVKAIGRGFPPESALKLLENEMMVFETIDLKKATGSDSERRSQKGRLIGRNGKTRELMEDLTGAEVRIYGNTFGVIGTHEQVDMAMTAAEMILDGAPHGTVYSFLEEKRRELKRNAIEYYER
ncbi:MAG: KH domain-containing protein, partial [Halobacteria archaeon]|nr:KH domain-containing protein [Halobacteria archaeon]